MLHLISIFNNYYNNFQFVAAHMSKTRKSWMEWARGDSSEKVYFVLLLRSYIIFYREQEHHRYPNDFGISRPSDWIKPINRNQLMRGTHAFV